MDKRADLEDRIRSGEAALTKLSFTDPKRKTIKDRIVKLQAELAELKVVAGPPLPLDRTYDRETSEKSQALGNFRAEHWHDPRPDLTEDSALWSAMLELAAEYDGELCAVLNGFRCGGTRLRFGDTRWTLRPDFDPTGRVAWESQTDYDEAKEKYLKEWGGVVGALLDELTRRWPSQPAKKPEQPVQMRMQI